MVGVLTKAQHNEMFDHIVARLEKRLPKNLLLASVIAMDLTAEVSHVTSLSELAGRLTEQLMCETDDEGSSDESDESDESEEDEEEPPPAKVAKR